MALSLSPHHFKQPIHSTSSLSNTSLQPYSTAQRHFTTVVPVHGSSRPDHEPLPMSQTKPLLLNSSFGHANVTRDDDIVNELRPRPSQVVPDLPSWTPLRTQENVEGSSTPDPEADELATRKETDSATRRLAVARPPTNAQSTAENTVTGPTLKSLSDAKPSKGKKARFDGILITTKPPPYRKFSAQTQPGHGSASSARASSLVDALARTFDANRHSEDSFPRQSRPALRQRDDASTGPQTDVETTEAEDEQLQLNARLARTPLNLKRRHGRPRIIPISANIAETNSEDAAPLVQHERPVKRLKAIQYEANPALIDKALGTVQAPISWDAEMDIITRDEDFVTPAQIAHVASADVRVAVEGDNVTASSPGEGPAPSSARTPAQNEWLTPALGGPEKTMLSPYLSRGAKFRQRLDAIFGENATVRTDRVARPRPVDYALFAPLDEYDREPSPSVSESTESVSSASTAEELASGIPSTHITSQSPDIIPPTDTNIDRLRREEVNEADASTGLTLGTNEEQMIGWIAALQRLVKGKVHVKEEDLETLSIILAEIESVKDNLDERVSTTLELRESVNQLSKLCEIPFGDRNKLRQRAENIIRTWPSVGELGAS